MKQVNLYKGKITLEFDEDKHKYFVNGRPTICVTEATSCKSKDALVPWACGLARDHLLDMAFKNHHITELDINQACTLWRKRRDEAAEIGTQVHDWIEKWTNKENPPFPEGETEFEKRVLNGIEAFLEWFNSMKIEIVAAETFVYSVKHDFVGRFDAIWRVGEKLMLTDYKTGSGFYTDQLYQTSAYFAARKEECPKEKLAGRIILNLNKNSGAFRIEEFIKPKDQAADFSAFLGLLAVKRRELELKEWAGSVNKKA